MRQLPYNILFTKGHIFLKKDMKGNKMSNKKQVKFSILQYVGALMFLCRCHIIELYDRIDSKSLCSCIKRHIEGDNVPFEES